LLTLLRFQPGWLLAAAELRLFELALHGCATLPLLLLGLFMPPVGLRGDAARCASCGYCLTGNVSGVCPECGQPVAQRVALSASELACTNAPSGTAPVFKRWFQRFTIGVVALLCMGYVLEGATGLRWRPPWYVLILVGVLLWRLKNTLGRADVVAGSELWVRLRRYALVVIPVDVLLLGSSAAAWESGESFLLSGAGGGERAVPWAPLLACVCVLWLTATSSVLRALFVSPGRKGRLAGCQTSVVE